MTKAEVIETRSNSNMMKIKVLDHKCKSHEIGNEYEVINSEDKFELIKIIIKKSDLRNGDIVTYRDKKKRIVNMKKQGLTIIEDFDNVYLSLTSLNEDLYYKDNEDHDFDVVKVYRPTTEETFYTEKTKKEIKEMTLKEVCKELGYEIKIIKE